MILKFRKNISEWYSLYANTIKNRLRRDLNLGDVCDVQETRDNIGLSGDNNHTHYHDDRYIPIIEKRINELDNKLNNIIPIGTIMTWPSNVPPDTYRWLECNGQSFDTTEYPDLYKVFPSGKVPDLRGVFLRGYGSQSSYTSGALGQLQGDAMRRIYGDIPNVLHGMGLWDSSTNWGFVKLAGNPSRIHWMPSSHITTGKMFGADYWRIPDVEFKSYTLSGDKDSGYTLNERTEKKKLVVDVICRKYQEFEDPASSKPEGGTGGLAFRTVSFDSSSVVPTANEVRPANIAVKFYIRAK